MEKNKKYALIGFLGLLLVVLTSLGLSKISDQGNIPDAENEVMVPNEDELLSETEVFKEYLTKLGVEVPDEPHDYLIITELSCPGCDLIDIYKDFEFDRPGFTTIIAYRDFSKDHSRPIPDKFKPILDLNPNVIIDNRFFYKQEFEHKTDVLFQFDGEEATSISYKTDQETKSTFFSIVNQNKPSDFS